jgi:hypothetical protein
MAMRIVMAPHKTPKVRPSTTINVVRGFEKAAMVKNKVKEIIKKPL